jgi:Ca-activated chloride channel homolog
MNWAAELSFQLPWALALLALLPPLMWWTSRPRRRPVIVFSSVQLVEPLPATWRTRLRWLPAALVWMSLACLIVAVARPRLGIGEVRTTATGVAMMMVVDRSLSMALPIEMDGVEVTRIDAVKRVFQQFVEGDGRDLKGRTQDLIGLVTFARYADTVCPLVRIHSTLLRLVQGIELADQRIEGGTAIGDGLALGAARLKQAEEDLRKGERNPQDPEFTIKSKVIVLLTDGDENSGEMRARQAAELCREWGIKIYAIGIGDERGGVLDTPAGRVIVPPSGGFDEGLMREITSSTGGRYWRATDAAALREAYEAIDKLETTEIKSREFTSYTETFMPLATASALGLALAMLLSSSVLRRSP